MSFIVHSLKNNNAVAIVTTAAAALATYLGRNVALFAGSSAASGGVFGLVASKTADIMDLFLNKVPFLKNGVKGKGQDRQTIPNHYRFVAKHLIGGAVAFGVTYGLAAAHLIAGVPVYNAVALTVLGMVLAKAVPAAVDAAIALKKSVFSKESTKSKTVDTKA